MLLTGGDIRHIASGLGFYLGVCEIGGDFGLSPVRLHRLKWLTLILNLQCEVIMAGTQELRSAPRIDCYSRTEFDDDVECGMVIDISATGAGLTVSKDTPLFKDVNPEQPASSYGCLDLSIFHPDHSLEDGLDIRANIAWIDHEYSKHRVKLGVQFSEMDDDKSSYVGKFIDWIQKEDNYFLHCELEKC